MKIKRYIKYNDRYIDIYECVFCAKDEMTDELIDKEEVHFDIPLDLFVPLGFKRCEIDEHRKQRYYEMTGLKMRLKPFKAYNK